MDRKVELTVTGEKNQTDNLRVPRAKGRGRWACGACAAAVAASLVAASLPIANKVEAGNSPEQPATKVEVFSGIHGPHEYMGRYTLMPHLAISFRGVATYGKIYPGVWSEFHQVGHDNTADRYLFSFESNTNRYSGATIDGAINNIRGANRVFVPKEGTTYQLTLWEGKYNEDMFREPDLVTKILSKTFTTLYKVANVSPTYATYERYPQCGATGPTPDGYRYQTNETVIAEHLKINGSEYFALQSDGVKPGECGNPGK